VKKRPTTNQNVVFHLSERSGEVISVYLGFLQDALDLGLHLARSAMTRLWTGVPQTTRS